MVKAFNMNNENQDTQNEFSDLENVVDNPPKRSTFLTVVCILTFIGSGFGIFNAITNYAGAELAVASMDMAGDEMNEAMDEMEESEAPEGVKDFFSTLFGDIQANLTVEIIRTEALGTGISCILTLIGAILMWMLNKKGFYLYLVGIVIYIITPGVVYTGIMSTMGVAWAAFIGILFSILYGVNLKHMRN